MKSWSRNIEQLVHKNPIQARGVTESVAWFCPSIIENYFFFEPLPKGQVPFQSLSTATPARTLKSRSKPLPTCRWMKYFLKDMNRYCSYPRQGKWPQGLPAVSVNFWRPNRGHPDKDPDRSTTCQGLYKPENKSIFWTWNTSKLRYQNPESWKRF